MLHSKESETETVDCKKPQKCSLAFHSPTCLFPQSKGKKPPVASNGVMGKGKAPSGQQKKADSAAGVKRTPSSKSTLPSPMFWLWVQHAELGLRGCLPSHLGRWRVPGLAGGRVGNWRERSVHTQILPCLLGCRMAVTFNLALRLLHTQADRAGSAVDLLLGSEGGAAVRGPGQWVRLLRRCPQSTG